MKKGYGNGMAMPGNMANLMKQAQRLQRKMEEQQKEIESKEFEGTAGGGAVKALFDGKRVLKKITIDPEVIDPEDRETLEELIELSVNSALSQIEEANEAAQSEMGLPGGLGL